MSNANIEKSQQMNAIFWNCGEGRTPWRPLDLASRWRHFEAPHSIFTDFQSTFACTVTASEKSSINTTTKSTTRFPMSLRWIVSVDPNPPSPKGGCKTQCQKFKQQYAITSKRYEIGCQLGLLLITNRMSHTVFRLVSTTVTLNDLELRNGPYYFPLFHRIR